MKSFSFTLKNVLKYRNQLLSNAQNEVANLNLAMEKHSELEKANRQEYQDTNAIFKQKQLGGVRPQMMQYYTEYLNQLNKRYAVLQKEREVLERRRHAAIDKMVRVKVDIASLEKLQEKELAEYQKAVAKEAERAVEEFVVYTRTVTE